MFVGMGSKHPPFSLVSLGSRSSFSSQLSRSKSSHKRVGVPNCSKEMARQRSFRVLVQKTLQIPVTYLFDAVPVCCACRNVVEVKHIQLSRSFRRQEGSVPPNDAVEVLAS